MCWNAPVSFLTFVSSLLMCLYLWHRNNNNNNDRALSIFIGWFALMQLFEFFMWRNMQDHSFASKMSFIFIHLQPLVLVASLYYFSLHNNKKIKNKYTITEQLVFGVIASVTFIKTIAAANYAFITNATQKWLSVKGPHCHLMWWFSRNINKLPQIVKIDNTWFMFLILGFIMIKPFTQGLLYFSFAIISALISRRLYPKEKGSLWCWIANFMGVIAIAMPHVMPYLKIF
jgi:hypothetical protein